MDVIDTELRLSKLNIPEVDAQQLLKISKCKSLMSGDSFISAGQVPQKFAFVFKGLFRYFYTDKAGNELTKALILENSIISSYSAMLYQTPSHFCIEALEDSEFLEINYHKWLELQPQSRFWDKFLIKALEKGYVTKEKRERDLLLLDATTRYYDFLEEFPGLEKRVTQQIIASYLGIKPESLSRIRKKAIT